MGWPLSTAASPAPSVVVVPLPPPAPTSLTTTPARRSISIFVSPASTEKRCTVLPSRRLTRSRASSQTARINSWFLLALVRFGGSFIRALQFRKDGLLVGVAEHAEACVAAVDELVGLRADQLAQVGDDRRLEVLRGGERIRVCSAFGLGNDRVH